MSGRNLKIDENDEYIDRFLDIKNKLDDLTFFLDSIEDINKIYRKKSGRIKSAAMKDLFEFFVHLPEMGEFQNFSDNLSQLKETFSKTIRSVKIGINFTSEMIPDSAGLLEVSYDKIYPKGNILERMVFKTFAGKE